MPDGGTLTIATANCQLDRQPGPARPTIWRRATMCVICVSDTGHRHAAGDPGQGLRALLHHQADRPGHRPRPVDDLWLRQAVGGHVRIESEVGQGTTSSSTCRATAARSTRSARGGRCRRSADGCRRDACCWSKTIPSVRLLIAEVLRELGYARLEAARRQRGAADAELQQPLDLLITDVGLPGLNGRQLAEIARQHRPDLKILFVTGYAEDAAAPGVPRAGHGNDDQALRARCPGAQDPRA